LKLSSEVSATDVNSDLLERGRKSTAC
jgi:hypothetical protein